jgi:hypothetical protein
MINSNTVFLRLVLDKGLPARVGEGIGDGEDVLSPRPDWLIRITSSLESRGASLNAYAKA